MARALKLPLFEQRPITIDELRAATSCEHDEQVRVVSWARTHEAGFPGLRRLYAIPNGGERHRLVAAKMKAEGQRKGVLDLHLPVPRGGHPGLWIEMKFGRNKLTPEQAAEVVALRADGFRVEVCYSAEAAIAVLTDYLTCSS